MELIGDVLVPVARLVLELPESFELAVPGEDFDHAVGAQGPDQLVLEVALAGEEACATERPRARLVVRATEDGTHHVPHLADVDQTG